MSKKNPKTKSKSRLEYRKEYWVTIGGKNVWQPLTEHEAMLERLKGHKVQAVTWPRRTE